MKKRTPQQNKKAREKRLKELLGMEFPIPTGLRPNNILTIKDIAPNSNHIWQILYFIYEQVLMMSFVRDVNSEESIYIYYDVPEEEFHRLEYACRHSISVTQIFCKKIRGQYKYKKIDNNQERRQS
jgi:hypothetical protein